MVDDELLDIYQVCKILNCSKKHFENVLVGRGFPRPFYVARVRYWFRKDIDCYLHLLSRGAFDKLGTSHDPQPPR